MPSNDKPSPSGHAFGSEVTRVSLDRARTTAVHQELRAARPALDKNLLRVLDESALDTSDAGAASSLDLPPTLTGDRMRRRSDVSRFRASADSKTTSAVDPDAFELATVKPSVAGHNGASASGAAVRDSDSASSLREDGPVAQIHIRVAEDAKSKGGDPEVAESSLSERAPSFLTGDDMTSPAPTVSAAQKAEYRRKSNLHFLALCWGVFGMGWNDGTTGPMLPRIQEHYHVRLARIDVLLQTQI